MHHKLGVIGFRAVKKGVPVPVKMIDMRGLKTDHHYKRALGEMMVDMPHDQPIELVKVADYRWKAASEGVPLIIQGNQRVPVRYSEVNLRDDQMLENRKGADPKIIDAMARGQLDMHLGTLSAEELPQTHRVSELQVMNRLEVASAYLKSQAQKK